MRQKANVISQADVPRPSDAAFNAESCWVAPSQTCEMGWKWTAHPNPQQQTMCDTAQPSSFASLVVRATMRFISNLYPGVPKTLSFRKPPCTRSTILLKTSLYTTHGLPGILYRTATLQHKFYSLIVCREGRSWQAKGHERMIKFLHLLAKIILTDHKRLRILWNKVYSVL